MCGRVENAVVPVPLSTLLNKKTNPHLSHWEVRICANLNNNLNFTLTDLIT